jgi:hypothetical protein
MSFPNLNNGDLVGRIDAPAKNKGVDSPMNRARIEPKASESNPGLQVAGSRLSQGISASRRRFGITVAVRFEPKASESNPGLQVRHLR